MSPLCRMINLPFANSVPKITPFIIAGLVDIMTYCSGVFWAHLSTESLFDTKGKNLLTLPSKNIQRRIVSSGATVVFFKTIFSVNLGLDPDPNYSTTVFYEYN